MEKAPASSSLPSEPPAGSPHGLFVGRERELAELAGALDAARAGRGGLYLLSGEPGIGKTRLGERCADVAAARGFAVLWGRCWESGGAPTYWPWVQVLRGAVRACNAPALLQAAGRIVAHLGQLVPELSPGLPASGWTPDLPLETPEQARVVLFDAVQTVLATLASERPLLVILDDLHAADESSTPPAAVPRARAAAVRRTDPRHPSRLGDASSACDAPSPRRARADQPAPAAARAGRARRRALHRGRLRRRHPAAVARVGGAAHDGRESVLPPGGGAPAGDAWALRGLAGGRTSSSAFRCACARPYAGGSSRSASDAARRCRRRQ